MVWKTLYDLDFHSFSDLISSYYPPHTHTPLQSRNYFSDMPIMLHPRAFAPALPLAMNVLLSADIPKADTITSFKFQFKGHFSERLFPTTIPNTAILSSTCPYCVSAPSPSYLSYIPHLHHLLTYHVYRFNSPTRILKRKEKNLQKGRNLLQFFFTFFIP